MICGCWGEDKCCKTTFALTFPKPLIFMEFDIGGFHRAIYRFQQEFDQGLIKYEAYPMPMTFGKFDPSKLEVRPSKTIVGMKELFYQWAAKYIQHLQSPEVQSISRNSLGSQSGGCSRSFRSYSRGGSLPRRIHFSM